MWNWSLSVSAQNIDEINFFKTKICQNDQANFNTDIFNNDISFFFHDFFTEKTSLLQKKILLNKGAFN